MSDGTLVNRCTFLRRSTLCNSFVKKSLTLMIYLVKRKTLVVKHKDYF